MPFLRADSAPWRQMSRAWAAMSAITTPSGSTCPSRQESAWGAAEARQLKVIVEVVRKRIVSGRCCNICWRYLQMFSVTSCPRREGVRRGAVLSSRCLASWPSPSTTVDRKRTSKRRHHVWSVERFALSFSFSFLRSVHGCMGMDVWVNVFTMPFLCADPGPWRRMGRAWPATSAKTTSATTCHQDSAWRGAESRQDRVIVEVVRKAIVVGKCCSMCRTHLQMFSVSTVLGEKASDVVIPDGHLPSFPTVAQRHTGQKRTTERRRHVWWVEGFALCFSSVHGWMGMDVWVNVFSIPFLRADSGPWRQVSRAWPAMSAITTPSGSTCPSRQESAWGAAEARQLKVIVEVVRKRIVSGRCCNICWRYLQMFSVTAVLGEKASDVEQSSAAGA